MASHTPRHNRPRQPAYPFPELEPSKIIECLSNLDISLTEQDLRKPSPNTVQRLYECLADKLMSIRYGQFTGSFEHPDVLEQMLSDLSDNPELHSSSLPLINFFHHWGRLFEDSGVPGFTLVDWLKPESKRLIVQLSGIINFARFRDVNLSVFDELTERSEQYSGMKDALLQENAQLKHKIQQIKKRRQEEEKDVENLENQVAAMNTELKQTKAKGDQTNNGVARLKQDRADYQDRLQNVQLMIQHAKQECIRLRSRIVHNPEQIKKSIVDMNATVQDMKRTFAANENKARDLSTKLDNRLLVEQDIASCLKMMEELELEMQAMEANQQKIAEERDMVDRKETELRELGIKESQLKRQEISCQEKLTRMHSQLTVKRDNNDVKLQKMRQEWENFSEEREKTSSQVSKFEETIAETSQKIGEIKYKHASEMNAVQSSFASLKDQVRAYMADLGQIMDADNL